AYVCGVAAVPLLYGLVRASGGSQRAALLASLGLALANGHVQWSGLSRGYACLVFFEIMTLWAFLHFQRERSLRAGAAFVVSGVLMVYSQIV
ncbi:MAG: phospholipid carrier-dependent glycosyltransferase, partial [Gammaproteobacteria bacterium]|nr:phospholipid carrier-dependent glycosyltransferase [Gammaproteobacteria bacterium]